MRFFKASAHVATLTLVTFLVVGCGSEATESSTTTETTQPSTTTETTQPSNTTATTAGQPSSPEGAMDIRVKEAPTGEDAFNWDRAVVVNNGSAVQFSFTSGPAQCSPVSRVVLTPKGNAFKAQLFLARTSGACIAIAESRVETVALPKPIPANTQLVKE